MLQARVAAALLATILGLARPSSTLSPAEPLLSYNCSGTKPPWSWVTLELPIEFAPLTGVTTSQVTAFNDVGYTYSKNQWLSVDTCAKVVNAALRREDSAANHNKLDFVAHFDVARASGEFGTGDGASIWLHLSFQGREQCDQGQCRIGTNRCRPYPAILIVSKESQDLPETERWQVLIENLNNSAEFSATLNTTNGQGFEITGQQFTRTASSRWWQLNNLTEFAKMRRQDLQMVKYKPGTPMSKTGIITLFDRKEMLKKDSELVEVRLVNCSSTNEGRETGATSHAGASQLDQALLIGGLCALIALVSLIGFAVFKQYRLADLLTSCSLTQTPTPPLRVAVVGCELHGTARRRHPRGSLLRSIQRRLSQDATGPRSVIGTKMAAEFKVFDGRDFAELREHSTEFDLVLLCLAPGQQLSEEQLQLVEMERWRFRVLMLANNPGLQVGENGELQPMVSPGDPDGADGCVSEDWVERLFRLAKQAYLRALEDSRSDEISSISMER